jgi:hypothetical protein
MASKQEQSRLRDFALAYLQKWATAMSGPLSVPLAIAALWVENATVKIIFGVTAFVCVWSSAYFVWKRERDSLIEANKKVTTLSDEINRLNPRLSGRIEQIIIGESGGRATCTVNLTIKNTGAPSIADRWSMTAEKDGLTLYCKLATFPSEGLMLQSSDPKIRIFKLARSDAVYDKAATPIPTGGQVRGWLYGFIDEINREGLNSAGTIITINFEDVNGNSHSATHMIKKEEFVVAPRYHPDGGGGPT